MHHNLVRENSASETIRGEREREEGSYDPFIAKKRYDDMIMPKNHWD